MALKMNPIRTYVAPNPHPKNLVPPLRPQFAPVPTPDRTQKPQISYNSRVSAFTTRHEPEVYCLNPNLGGEATSPNPSPRATPLSKLRGYAEELPAVAAPDAPIGAESTPQMLICQGL